MMSLQPVSQGEGIPPAHGLFPKKKHLRTKTRHTQKRLFLLLYFLSDTATTLLVYSGVVIKGTSLFKKEKPLLKLNLGGKHTYSTMT